MDPELTQLLQVAVLVAAAGVSVGTIASFLGARFRVLDLAAHFRPHLAIAAAVTAVAAMLLLHSLPVAGLAAVMAFANIAAMRAEYPYGISRAGDDGEGATLSIGVLNVNFRNRNHAPIEHWIRQAQPDVLVIVEVSPPWLDAIERLSDLYPYRALRRTSFVTMIARRPWTSFDVMPGPRTQQAILVAGFDVEGTTLTVIGAHPASPTRPHHMRARDAELDTIARLAVGAPGPVSAMGDFNAAPWSAPMRRLVRTSPLRYPDLVATTWPAFLPRWLGIKIDHIMVGKGCAVIDYKVGPNVGSDHRPVVATIRVALPSRA
ncbi:MAG TPA: endonuclease/exonuclease/phosphatase family protein [Vineibacter sp.]|nr:endonuclease/exonuclease/phosphatase family protein [Vineibacter sp.]